MHIHTLLMISIHVSVVMSKCSNMSREEKMDCMIIIGDQKVYLKLQFEICRNLPSVVVRARVGRGENVTIGTGRRIKMKIRHILLLINVTNEDWTMRNIKDFLSTEHTARLEIYSIYMEQKVHVTTMVKDSKCHIVMHAFNSQKTYAKVLIFIGVVIVVFLFLYQCIYKND